VIADGPGTCVIFDGIDVRNLSADQTVVLTGFEIFSFFMFVYADHALSLEDNLGPVRIENCKLSGSDGENLYSSPDYHPDGWDGVHIENCQDVSLIHCSMTGGDGDDIGNWGPEGPTGDGGQGIIVIDSKVVLYDCGATGGPGGDAFDVCPCDGGYGGNGCFIEDSFLFASGGSFKGGKGGFGGDQNSAPGCDGGNGGHGICILGNASEAMLLDNKYTGGKGGAGGYGYPYNGSPGSSGRGVNVYAGNVDYLNGEARTFQMPSPVREYEQLIMTFKGETDDLVVIVLDSSTGSTFKPGLHGQFLLALINPFRLVAGTIPASGTLELPVTIPGMGPGFSAAAFYIQPIFLANTGSFYLGSLRSLIVLDVIY
jgi:hypothetical protein